MGLLGIGTNIAKISEVMDYIYIFVLALFTNCEIRESKQGGVHRVDHFFG